MDAVLDIGIDLRTAADQCSVSGRCRSVCDGCQVRLFAVCSALDDNQIANLERLAKQTHVPARSPFLLEGDRADAVYTLTSGFVRLQQDLADGRRQVVGFLAPGDFIGLNLGEHYPYGADALTDATLCRFDRDAFANLTRREPALLEKLYAMTSHELSLAQEHMVLLGRRKAEERVALFLIGWRKRLQRVIGQSPTLPLPMGRQDIADHLGLTIETVSRIMARLARGRVTLEVPGGVRILDEAGLRTTAGA